MIGAISTCQVWKYTHGCRLLAVIQYLLQCLIVFVFTNLIVNQSTMYRFLERKKIPLVMIRVLMDAPQEEMTMKILMEAPQEEVEAQETPIILFFVRESHGGR
jgi:hypothetical protein